MLRPIWRILFNGIFLHESPPKDSPPFKGGIGALIQGITSLFT
jgi:hypothetical protein